MPGVGTTHHIRLGGNYYLLKPGSYQRRAAPQFGARFATGDPDYNNLSFWQHWAQSCWIGGMDAEDWADDSMFHEAVGIDSTDHERLSLSRDLTRSTGGVLAATAGPTWIQHKYVIYNNKLYAYTVPSAAPSRLYEYLPGTDTWSQITQFAALNMIVRSVTTFNGRLYFGGLISGAVAIRWTSGAMTSYTTVAAPTTGLTTPYAMRAFQQKLYVAFGTAVWRLKTDNTWDGTTVFYNASASSESNYIAAMEIHNGYLWMLSQNAHVHMTDGNTTTDRWNWDGQTIGRSLKSFDGRLFVLTEEYTNTTDVGFGVLYQMTGSAMTELKRWGNDAVAAAVYELRVHDRKLFYGASNLLGLTTRRGFGVAVYDPVEDAHSIIASNCDTTTYPAGNAPYYNHVVDDCIIYEGYLFAMVRGYGSFRTPYRPRDASLLQARYDISQDGWLTTSTYDAGTPGLRKMWRRITVDYTIPATGGGSIKTEYSTDAGKTWTVAGTTTTAGDRVRVEYNLENITSVSFKLRFTLDSSSATYSPSIYGFVVSYIPVPEANFLWTFTIVLSERQELLDGTIATLDTEAALASLGDAYRNKALLNFVDVDGTEWATAGRAGVLVYDFGAWLPDLDGALEGEVQLSLLEAVETY